MSRCWTNVFHRTPYRLTEYKTVAQYPVPGIGDNLHHKQQQLPHFAMANSAPVRKLSVRYIITLFQHNHLHHSQSGVIMWPRPETFTWTLYYWTLVPMILSIVSIAKHYNSKYNPLSRVSANISHQASHIKSSSLSPIHRSNQSNQNSIRNKTKLWIHCPNSCYSSRFIQSQEDSSPNSQHRQQWSGFH